VFCGVILVESVVQAAQGKIYELSYQLSVQISTFQSTSVKELSSWFMYTIHFFPSKFTTNRQHKTCLALFPDSPPRTTMTFIIVVRGESLGTRLKRAWMTRLIMQFCYTRPHKMFTHNIIWCTCLSKPPPLECPFQDTEVLSIS